MHIDQRTQHPRRLPHLHDIIKFEITASQLHGLASAYNKLFEYTETHTFVATTALGGGPALLHLVETFEQRDRPADIQGWSAFYNGIAERLHLFPGLGWSETIVEENLMFDWLSHLPGGSTVLLFDTGTDGNGVRRLANMIRERVQPSLFFGPSTLTVVGIVDGVNEAQKAIDVQLRSQTGSCRLVVEYQHVPKMLTEDCQALIGYESLRKHMLMDPVAANAVIEIVDDGGKHLQTIGARNGATALRSAVHGHMLNAPVSDDIAEGVNWFTRAIVLLFAQKDEMLMLANAYENGLIDGNFAEQQAQRLKGLYRKQVEAEGGKVWDFSEKKTAVGKPT